MLVHGGKVVQLAVHGKKVATRCSSQGQKIVSPICFYFPSRKMKVWIITCQFTVYLVTANISWYKECYSQGCKQVKLELALLVQARLVKLELELKPEPSSRLSPKIVFKLNSYIN